MKYVILSFLALTLTLSLTAEPAATTQAKPSAMQSLTNADAKEAVREYTTRELDARRAYFDLMSKANADLLRQLTTVKDQLTRRGELDEAVRVRDAIAELYAGKQAVRQQTATAVTASPSAKRSASLTATGSPDPYRGLAGTQWARQNTERKWTMTLNADMTATSTHHAAKGTWAVVPSDQGVTIRASISMNNCGSELLQVSDDGSRLLNPKGGVEYTRVK